MELRETSSVAVCIVGESGVGVEVAERLAEGTTVGLVSSHPAAASLDGVDRHVERLPVETPASSLGVDADTLCVVAAESDRRGLLLASKLRASWEVDRVVACVHDSDRESTFEAAGFEPISVPGAVARAVEARR